MIYRYYRNLNFFSCIDLFPDARVSFVTGPMMWSYNTNLYSTTIAFYKLSRKKSESNNKNI